MKFRAMRRSQQALSPEECRQILERNTAGVLAVLGDGGYPYAVPLSYVYDGEEIYFHCAVSGHKLDAIRACPKVSFCVTDQDQVRPEQYTTHYRSVILFGQIRQLTEPAEITAAINKLALKYNPEDSAAHRSQTINQSLPALCLLAISIEHISGKQSKYLVPQQA